MSKTNLFLKDIDVPEIVQKKADTAFLSIRTEGKKTMKKGYYKVMAAAAACVALIAVTGVSAGIWNRSGLKDNAGEEGNPVLAEIDRMFTLKVRAAELEAGNPVPLFISVDNPGYVLGADDKEMSYCINVPLTCEGEGIESVTYSINNGAFQIVQPENKDERIIVSGQLYGEDMHTGWIGGDYDEENDGLPSRPYEAVLYKSFTLDYERQSDEYTWINICNAGPYDEEILNLIWGERADATDESNGINKLLDHTVITCTVHYADGTEQAADIQVESQPMMEDIGDGEMAEVSVITFELQK